MFDKSESRLNILHHTMWCATGIAVIISLYLNRGVAPSEVPLFWYVACAVLSLGFYIKETNEIEAVEPICQNIREAQEVLITSGFYRWSRNPCYLGQILMVGGFCLISLSWYVILSFVILVLTVNATVRQEEKRLEARFGEAYRTYCKQVGRWLSPRLLLQPANS